jgi:tetratricopeptide (TPR) repeat protein
MELIDNFLNKAGNQTRIVPSDNSSVPDKDFSVKSVEENDDLMTETLANIHIKQGRYQKAIEIFERLRLKYPEKSVYFARRIEEMEELINKQ